MIGLGYAINHPNEAIRQALEKANRVVFDSMTKGRAIRDWSTLFRITMDGFFTDSKREGNRILIMNRAVHLENELSSSIRDYFGMVSNQLEILQKLNPPLTSEQLDPYVAAILSDRRATMTYLESLSPFLNKLQSIKNGLILQRAS